jgi:glycosyltransferase involved in cell wall biosynthesis
MTQTDITEVTALDVAQIDDNSRRMSAGAVLSARRIEQYLADLEYMCEWDLHEDSVQEAQELIEETRGHLVELRDALVETISINSGLVAALRALVAQRDRALDNRLSVDDVADLVADAQYCAPEDARQLLEVLLSSDEDLLSSDTVLDHDWLSDVRRQITDVIAEVNQLIG